MTFFPCAWFRESKVACGGAAKVSPTFGAALWTMDYIIQSLLLGVQRLYFHHGTLGNSQFFLPFMPFKNVTPKQGVQAFKFILRFFCFTRSILFLG